MLYVTTREKQDTYTALRTLGFDRGSDGGLFIPFRLPKLTEGELDQLLSGGFSHAMAGILNIFFSARMNGGDVDFTVGRRPMKLQTMSHRIAIAEVWHNQKWTFDHMAKLLTQRILGRELPEGATEWGRLAVRIGALFGIFAELRGNGWDGQQTVDVALSAGDFSAPMSAWYARELGLPIETIVCGCTETSAPWDLLHQGELRSRGAHTPDGLERLICCRLGWEAAGEYRQILGRGGIYTPDEEQFEILRQGFFAAVISPKRVQAVIPKVYNTNAYLLSPESACAYGGLQDYRAITGESRPAVLLTEESPLPDGGEPSGDPQIPANGQKP